MGRFGMSTPRRRNQRRTESAAQTSLAAVASLPKLETKSLFKRRPSTQRAPGRRSKSREKARGDRSLSLRPDLAVPHPAGQEEDHDDADDDEREPDHFRVRLRADSKS